MLAVSSNKVRWRAITRNINWCPLGFKGLFLSHSLSWVHQFYVQNVLCVDIFYVHFKNQSLLWEQSRSKKREELLVKRGSSLRDSSSPQTPASLHRSLINDSHCPKALPLSDEGPSRLALNTCMLHSKWTQPGSTRNRQNGGFQRAGLLAFPCLWEIKSKILAWFTLPLFIPLERKQEMRRSTCKGQWKGGLRVTEWLVRSRVVLAFCFSFSLWSSSSVVTEKWLPLGLLGSVGVEGSEGIIPFCLSGLYITCLTKWMLFLGNPLPTISTNEAIVVSFLVFS